MSLQSQKRAFALFYMNSYGYFQKSVQEAGFADFFAFAFRRIVIRKVRTVR